ncbi:MAG: bifunctional demethylmenaquinone methyltransferase/2-methoxy-6-polyprenyl-1,4-benzoquinol methylase UbiE [Phycisphaerae bacterium]|nr:bifunctional demethylmenaquinone methyltransferase/2-methoxy-6-polyprenyl-1,4-benzoquinol methylase UbiE [Phycisphaerae bacterium]
MVDEPVWTPAALQHDPHADQDKARKVQAMFAAIARHYDLNNRLHSLGQDQAWRRAAVRAAGVDGTTRVLDVACGTGDLTQAFARAGAGSVTGVDFTPQMLDVARFKAAKAFPTVAYEQGDAMALRFADASMDVVSIAFGIRNVQQPAKALAEFARVLRPGGRLVVLEFSEPSNPLVRAASSLYTRHIMPWTATIISRDRSGAYRYLPKSVSTFANPQEFKGLIERAGFHSVTDTALSLGICRIYRGVRP